MWVENRHVNASRENIKTRTMFHVPHEYLMTYNPNVTELHTDSSDFEDPHSTIFKHMKTHRKRSTKILYSTRNNDTKFHNCKSESPPVTELSSKETWTSVTTSISQNGITIGLQMKKSFKNKKYKYEEGGDQSPTVRVQPKRSVMRHKVIPCLSNIFGRSNNVKQMSIIKENPTENVYVDNGYNVARVNCEHKLRKFNRRQQCYAAQPVYAVEGNIHAKTTPFQHTKIVREPLTTCKAVGNGNCDMHNFTSSSEEVETQRYFTKKKGKRPKPKHIVESGIGKEYFERYEGKALNIQQQCPSKLSPMTPYFIYPTPDQYQNTGCSPIQSSLNRSGFELGSACSGFWEYIVNKINTKLQNQTKKPDEATNTSMFKTCKCDEHKVKTTFDYVCPKCENQSIWCPTTPQAQIAMTKEACGCYRPSCAKMHENNKKNYGGECYCHLNRDSQVCCIKHSDSGCKLPPAPTCPPPPCPPPPSPPPPSPPPPCPPPPVLICPPGGHPGSPRRIRIGVRAAPPRIPPCPPKQTAPKPCPPKPCPPKPCPPQRQPPPPVCPQSPPEQRYEYPSPPATPPPTTASPRDPASPTDPAATPDPASPPDPGSPVSPPSPCLSPRAPVSPRDPARLVIPPPPPPNAVPPCLEPRPCQFDHDDVTGAISKQYKGEILCIHNPPCVLINGCLNLPGMKEPLATDLYSVTTNVRTNKFDYQNPKTKFWQKQQSAQYYYPTDEIQPRQIIRDASCQCFAPTLDMMSSVHYKKNESCQYYMPHVSKQLITRTSGIHFHSSPINGRKLQTSDHDSLQESISDIHKHQATDIDFKYWLSPKEIRRQQNASPVNIQYRPSPTEVPKQSFPLNGNHERPQPAKQKRSKIKRPKHEKNIQSICSHNPPCEVARSCCRSRLNPKLQNSCVHVPMCENVPLCLLELKDQYQKNYNNECLHKPKCTEVPICTRKYIVLTAKEEAATQVRPKAKMECRHRPPCIMIPTCLARVCDSYVPFDAIPDCIHQPMCDMIPACCRKSAKEMVSFRSQYPSQCCIV